MGLQDLSQNLIWRKIKLLPAYILPDEESRGLGIEGESSSKKQKNCIRISDHFGVRSQVIQKLVHFTRKVLPWHLFCCFFHIFFSSSGGWEKVKRKLTTLPRFFMPFRVSI